MTLRPQGKNTPRKIKLTDPSFEQLVVVAELVRHANQGGVPKPVLLTHFLDPQKRDTQIWLDQTLSMFESKGIITKVPKGNEKIQLTSEGYQWARERISQFSTEPPPPSKSSVREAKVIPFTRY